MTQAKPPRPRSRLSGLSVWLSILALAMLFLPLSLLSRAIRAADVSAHNTLIAIQTDLASVPNVPDDLDTLVQTRLDWLAQAQALTSARNQLIALHVNFPATTSILLNYRPENMMLTLVQQNETSEGAVSARWLLVGGEAHYETEVIDYVGYLRQSGMFERVDVQAITLQSSEIPATLRAAQATIDANAPTMPHFDRGLQWVTFTLRLTWSGGGS